MSERRTKMNIIFTSTPCIAAQEWLDTQTDPEEAWNNCHKEGWMIWVLTHLLHYQPSDAFLEDYQAFDMSVRNEINDRIAKCDDGQVFGLCKEYNLRICTWIREQISYKDIAHAIQVVDD